MFEDIKKKREEVRNNILKSFSSEDIFEKAHKDGDLHPNGKWVWVSSAAGGKGDWRTINGRTHKKHQTVANAAKDTSTDTLKKVASSDKAPKELKNRGKSESSTPLSKNMQIKVNRISHSVETIIKRLVFGKMDSDKDVDFSKVKLEKTGTYFKLSYDGKEVYYFERNSDFTPKAVKAAISEGFKTRMPK